MTRVGRGLARGFRSATVGVGNPVPLLSRGANYFPHSPQPPDMHPGPQAIAWRGTTSGLRIGPVAWTYRTKPSFVEEGRDLKLSKLRGLCAWSDDALPTSCRGWSDVIRKHIWQRFAGPRVDRPGGRDGAVLRDATFCFLGISSRLWGMIRNEGARRVQSRI
jgi:hypothetical protein